MKTILDEFNLDNSTNYKLSVLRKYKDNPLFLRILRLALDGVKYNFYIRKIPPITVTNEEYSLEEALDFLEFNLNLRLVTGNQAISELSNIMGKLSDDNRYIIERILERDLKIGLGKTQVNKIIPNLVVKLPYARCDQYSQKTAKHIKYPAICQLKADGSFCNIILSTNEMISRSGQNKDFLDVFNNTFEEIRNNLLNKVGESEYVLHGEILYRGHKDRKIGNGIVNKADKGTISYEEANNCYLQVWDIIPASDFANEVCNIPYEERFDLLKSVIPNDSDKIELIPAYTVNSLKEALLKTSEWMSLGYEGSILKSNGHLWASKTMKTQLKLKLKIEADVRITGFTEGNGRFATTFGAITFGTDDGKVKGQCSGISDKDREEFNLMKEALIGQIITVSCNDITIAKDSDTYALSHPNFETLRSDKTESDTLERILENKQMAMELSHEV